MAEKAPAYQDQMTPSGSAIQQQRSIAIVEDCKNFLSEMLHSNCPEATVRDLIQGLINGKLAPEDFQKELQKLKTKPLPDLVPRLKITLPLLRQSLFNNEMTIDGVIPPPVDIVQQHQSKVTQSHAGHSFAYNQTQKTKRETVKDEEVMYTWTNWKLIMTPVKQDGFVRREGRNIGFRHHNIEALFEDRFGVFELQITRGNCQKVTYVQHGTILILLQQYCSDGYKRSATINRALRLGYSINVRHIYVNFDNGKENATTRLRQLLALYDYAWNRSRREDVHDNDLPGEWSGWSKIMKPGELEKDWVWRHERHVGFKAKNLDGIFKDVKDDYGVFELAIEKPYKKAVVHVGQGKVLSEIKKHCKNSLPVNDALVKGYNIFARYRDVKSAQSAKDVEYYLVERYEYRWNPLYRTKREEVDDSCLPGKNWSEWQLLMAPRSNGPGWKRRDSDQTGYRLTDDIVDDIVRDERGIYEWMISKDRCTIVVYAGKTKHLSERLKDYCTKGSQLKECFNRALQHEFGIWVRTRPTSNFSHAENKLLDRYNYAWNKSRNGQSRDIFCHTI